MPSLNKTPNYGLTQYDNNGRDTVSLLKDYNEDNKIIDLALKAQADKINQLKDEINQLKGAN